MNETQKAVSAATSPQAALLQIAISLDRLHDKLDATPTNDPNVWGTDWDKPASLDNPVVKFTMNDRQRREQFALDVLQLDDEAAKQYGWNGPVWFYEHNRDIVVQHGRGVHVAMIQDAETYDPEGAANMGRDLLKAPATGMDDGVNIGGGA